MRISVGTRHHSLATWSRLLLLVAAFVAIVPSASAQFPNWNGGNPKNDDGSTAIAPVAWPSDAQWIAYSWGTTYPDNTVPLKHQIHDPRVQDPSNGGTTPQNYVNVSSGCTDKTLPSISYFYSAANGGIIFFRWRVEQIANDYGTGTSPGAFSAGNPWKSALWTVFFDTDGNGFRDFAAHLDGSSGSPAAPVDTLRTIWSTVTSNSIDYNNDPNIHSLRTNPTAFATTATGQILQFDGTGTPSTIQWPNGASETTWDYGTTRAINISTGACNEYFVDYEIPVTMLNAAIAGGPTFGPNTPFQFLFATANSLNNPFQKDVVWDGNFVCDATAPGPFGDALTLNLGIIPQPITTSFSLGSPNGCSRPVTAQIMDALTVTNCQTVTEVVSAQFKYWYDTNGNGLADDAGSTWVNIGDPTNPIGTTVTANWNTTNLIQGQYLFALEMTDSRGHTTDTWLSNGGATNVPLVDNVTSGLYSNAPVAGISAATLGVNYTKVTIGGTCGVSPSGLVTKSHSINAGSTYPAGVVSVSSNGAVTYKLTINNTSSTPIAVTSLTDTLPTGFTYLSTDTSSAAGHSTLLTGGSVSGSNPWTFTNVSVPGSTSRDFIFSVNAGTSAGTFFNTATFTTNVGPLSANDPTGVTVTTATLTATKTAALVSDPSNPISAFSKGDSVRFTITYTNNSTTTVTPITITDTLPAGFTYSASSPAATIHPVVGVNGTVTWSAADLTPSGSSLAAGVTAPTVTVDAIATQSGSFTNTATICPNTSPCNAAPVQPSVTGVVSGPLLAIYKTANETYAPLTATVDYTIEYANIGNAPAAITTLTDALPSGFTITGVIPAGCGQSGRLVTCTAGPAAAVNTTLAAGATATVTLHFTVASTSGTGTVATTNASPNVTGTGTTFTTQLQAGDTITISGQATSYTVLSITDNTHLILTSNATANGSGLTFVMGPTLTNTATINASNASPSSASWPYTLTGGTNTCSPTSYFFHAATTAITGLGSVKTATTTQINTPTTIGLVVAQAYQEIARFYSDPADSTNAYLISVPAVTLAFNSDKKIDSRTTLYDFNPNGNTTTQLAQGVTAGNLNGGTGIVDAYNLTVTASAPVVLAAGHRLLWTIEVRDSNASGSTTYALRFDGTASTAPSDLSKGTVCKTPILPSISKSVDNLYSDPGTGTAQLTYTLTYANTSSAAIPSVVITDPLPTGTTFVSASNSGSNIGGVVTWNIGTVNANTTASVTETVAIPFGITGTTLTNTVTLANGYTANRTAAVTTTLGRPILLISKRTNFSARTPGQAVTFTVDVTNGGNGTANTAVMTDTIPAYMTTSLTATKSVAWVQVTNGGSGYVSAPTVTMAGGATATAIISGGSVVAVRVTSGGSGYVSAPAVTFGSGAATAVAGLGTVAVSGSTVTFTMATIPGGTTASFYIPCTVNSTGVPAGSTVVTNSASVADNYTSAGPATATVTITATPVLTLTETATPIARRVVFVDVTNGGSFTSPPTGVTISGNGCTGVVATVSTSPAAGDPSATGPYTVTGVTITNAGSGCTAGLLPTVAFTGGVQTIAPTTIPTVGPAPGDTITYAITVTNTGNADASGVVVTGNVPANTTYFSGGTFSGGSVSTNVGTLPPGVGNAQTLTYIVTVNATLPYSYSSPFGVTTITGTGAATSTNATSPAPTSVALSSGVSPRYTIAKGPDNGTLPFPATTLSGSASNSTTIAVTSASYLSVGDYVVVSGTVAKITAISGSTVTLSTGVTGAAGASVILTEHYTINYANAGIGAGANVTIKDVLPANLLYAGVPTGAAVPTSSPLVGSNGNIVWTIGALTNGGSGAVELLAYPSTAGTYTDTAIISDGTGEDTRNAFDTAATTFGALNPTKVTNSPQVTNGSPSNVATYVITVQNPLPSATATSVVITDSLPSGFTYISGTTKINNVAAADPAGPGSTTSTPVWNGVTLNIAPASSLTLQFNALVASSVATGSYDNAVGVTSSVPSLTFDYLATTAENVQVCDAAPAITAPAVCASSTGNVASITSLPSTTYSWSITNGTITNFNTGTVDHIVLGSGGTGYTTPTISFTGGGGGTGATATATVVSGVIQSIDIVNPGSGYTSAPTVVITGSSTTAATTQAVIGRGIIYTAASTGPVALQVILTSGVCTVTQTKSVTVNTAPSISSNPSSVSICNNPTTVNFSVTASGSGGVYQWQVSTDGGTTFNPIGGATSSTYSFSANPATEDLHQYRVVVGSGACTVTSSAATIHNSCNPDLEATTDSYSANPVLAGTNVTLTQVVSNVSSQTAHNASYTQSLPTNTTFVSITPPAGWSCPTVPAVGASSGTITCNAAANMLPNTSSGSFALVVNVPANTADGATVSDTITVSTTDTDLIPGNNSKTSSITVQRLIDVQVVVDDNASATTYGPHYIYPGNPPTAQSLDWIITVGNGGPSMGSNVVVTDTLPSGFTYVSASTSNLTGAVCTPSNGNTTVTCTIGNLMPTVGVTLVGGGGSGASVYPVVSGGQITGLNIVTGGSGYTTPPTVVFSGAGTGAAATAVLTNGVITGFSFSNAGSGYGTPGTITIHGTTDAVAAQIADPATATYNETDTNPSNDSSSDTVIILGPTVVKMLTMDGKQDRTGVVLTWKTTFEVDNLGFYVWRESAAGVREKVSAHIIPGSALFNGKGIGANTNRSYRFVDHGAKDLQFFQYYIEDVDLKGVHTMHGPISPAVVNSAGTNAVTTDPDPTLGSVGGIFITAPGMGVTAPAPSAPAAQRLAAQWTLAGAPAAKLIVTKPGWYQIKKSDLIAAGFDPGTNSRNLSLFADGIEVPILVPSGTFGTSSTIEFYGTPIDTPTAGGHVYYLTTKSGSGLRVKSGAKTSGGSAAPANFTYGFDRTERTILYSALTNNGDNEFILGAIVSTWPVTNSLTAANIDPLGGNASVRIVLQGVNEPFNHIVDVNLNGTDLGLIRFSGKSRSVTDFSVPLSVLVAGENTLTFTATGGDDDVSLVETVHLSYPHTYRADSNALAFTAPASTSITVTGFTRPAIRVVDLTDPQSPVMLDAAVAQATDGTSSATFVTTGTGSRTMLAIADDRVLPPAQVAVNEVSTLNATTNAADLVIITNRAFATAAASLKTARDAQGIKTSVVDVQNVYDEFSYGAHGPEAIRSFLQRATSSWTTKPRWVLLLGDASSDPRNYLGLGSFDFVPTKLVPTQYLKTSSDDWFTDFSGLATPAIPVGRIPVRTADEASAVINKLVRRATTPPAGPWASSVMLISDRVNGVPFDKGSDQLAALVGAPYQTSRISFATSTDPTSDVVNAFNSGNLLTNYLGHGSIELWSNYVFTSTSAAALTNGDKLPFVVTMNCLNGFFHDIYSESLAEVLLKNPNGGAIGAWASSALTSPDQQLKVDLELYRQLFSNSSITIGDAILKAKLVTTDTDVRRTWILFGDPSMKLRP
jgi:uncharacterized repeat protein (TIGR01451 family)